MNERARAGNSDRVNEQDPDSTVVSSGHGKAIRRLKKLLAMPRKFQLILLRFNDPTYRDRLVEDFQKRAPSGRIVILKKDDLGDFSPFEQKLAKLSKSNNPIQVLGLERWAHRADPTNFFKGFNYHREAIAELNVTLLLWLTGPDIKRFAVEAPDMWAWRATVLDFDIPGKPSPSHDQSTSDETYLQAPAPERSKILIIYSHHDRSWMKRLLSALKPLFSQDSLELWDHIKIKSGMKWRQEIEHAIGRSRIVVLMVSIDFLASDFIGKNFLPPLLDKAGISGLQVLWIPLGSCDYEKTPIASFQAAWDPARPLQSLSHAEQDVAFTIIATNTKKTLESKPFRVLLLATEKDLGQARQRIAAYLRNVLNMEVSTESTMDPSSFDLVILLQAWWWDGGVSARAWEKADAAKRVLFAVSEDADWPPRGLIEREAEDHIESFRANYPDAHIYHYPDELPELIGAMAGRAQSEQSSHRADYGLTETERDYLKFRLGMWKHGRTHGRAYLSEKIYSDNLYVSLDGTSPHFQQDPEGKIIPAKEDMAERMGIAGSEPARLPLGRWASRADFPRLVLSGSPGAGKTTFLTRFAATLASVLLGRDAGLEPHIDFEEMRIAANRLPIPVVLEAVSLVKGSRGRVDTLVRSVAEELAAVDNIKFTEEVKRGLHAGRYLLLIDALDEIPVDRERRAMFGYLKSLLAVLTKTRIILTTRSARYTGTMAFGPEFELVEIAPLNDAQVSSFVVRFRAVKHEPPSFENELSIAIQALKDRAGNFDEDSLTGNPLLLTTICSVYHRQRRLPDDRAELCDQVIYDLCRARISVDEAEDWALNSNEKRDLLERLALAMQEQGSQDWPVGDALTVIAASLPENQAGDRRRVNTNLSWLVEHTGLLYFQEGSDGERIRFQHRLFREYLAASRLTRGEQNMETLIMSLWRNQWLTDPFWFDVIRLLPGAMNSPEKAVAMASAISTLAEKFPANRGRLTAVLAATLVENRYLFKRYDVSKFTAEATGRYEAEGREWKFEDGCLFLESIGKLGDPRLDVIRPEAWVRFPPGAFTMGDEEARWEDEIPAHRVRLTQEFMLGKYPVSNAEYRRFMDDGGYQNPRYWHEEAWGWLHLGESSFRAWFEKQKQRASFSYSSDWFRPGTKPRYWDNLRFNGPNQPVVGINWYEAEAYCRWLNEKLAQNPPAWWPGENFLITLPTEAQWEFAAKGLVGRKYPWGNELPNVALANYEKGKINQTTPVGAYPRGATSEGMYDMAGNVWEWCRDVWDEKAYPGRKDETIDPIVVQGDPYVHVLRGGSCYGGAEFLRTSYRFGDHAWFRADVIGFRCCLIVRPSDSCDPLSC